MSDWSLPRSRLCRLNLWAGRRLSKYHCWPLSLTHSWSVTLCFEGDLIAAKFLMPSMRTGIVLRSRFDRVEPPELLCNAASVLVEFNKPFTVKLEFQVINLTLLFLDGADQIWKDEIGFEAQHAGCLIGHDNRFGNDRLYVLRDKSQIIFLAGDIINRAGLSCNILSRLPLTPNCVSR